MFTVQRGLLIPEYLAPAGQGVMFWTHDIKKAATWQDGWQCLLVACLYEAEIVEMQSHKKEKSDA